MKLSWSYNRFDELSNYKLYEILRLRIEIFMIEQECLYSECDNKDYDGLHLLGYDEDNELVAYTRILPAGFRFEEASIGRVAISKKGRGKGLAREMMIKAIDHITNTMRQNEIRISAQEYLLKFYQDLGFKIVSDIYSEDGIPHAEMLFTKK
ncbi:MAG: GNAT family N-acetyltransferase [Bacteroidales bacterium]|nr:GNAT family N-acetyltransferase [Bacteroidales bacterium]